jgi:thioredoxin
MSTVLHVNDQNFQAEVLESEVPVLVDFYATWCQPCKKLTPIVEQLATEYDGKAKFAKIDIDEAPGVASSHGIMAVPTLILFKGGQKEAHLTGFKAKPALQKVLNDAL